MNFHGFVLGDLENNSYVVWNNGPFCIIIDAPMDIERLDPFLEEKGLRPQACLLTHGHFDHIAGLRHLRRQYGLRVAIHQDDADALIRPELNGSMLFGDPLPPDPGADLLLADGGDAVFSDIAFRVIHTPGHTPGGCCFLADDLLFSGDTLFRMGVGRTDFPGASHKKIMQSIQEKLFSLPDGTRVFPGHGPSSTIGDEKRRNPFVNRAGNK